MIGLPFIVANERKILAMIVRVLKVRVLDVKKKVNTVVRILTIFGADPKTVWSKKLPRSISRNEVAVGLNVCIGGCRFYFYL